MRMLEPSLTPHNTESPLPLPQLLGTAEEVADQLEKIWRETGCHGFNLTPAIVPGGYEDFIDGVVPILQRRGIFRTAYEATTLRGNLLG